jgi:hypothetical protein
LAYHILDAKQISQCDDMRAQMIVFSQDSRLIMQSYREALTRLRGPR